MQDEKKNENEIEKQPEKEQAENGQTTANEQNAENEQTEELPLNMYKRRKRDGKFVSKLSDKELDSLQRKKSLFMYLSTLFFAISLFLEVEGRAKLSDNKPLFALFTLYVISLVVLIALSVFISVMNRTRQKIKREIRECDTPRSGLDRRTFTSYELFNALHVLVAAAEIAVSVYKIGVWGAINIAVSATSAVTCFISRQILYKANAGNVEFVPAEEE